MLHSVFIDQLMSPSHHFGGLSTGNTHSQSNQYKISNPQKAALQGLYKMNQVAQLAVPQYIFPPHIRQYEKHLQNLGYLSDNPFQEAFDCNPQHLSIVFSASSTWCANWATFTASTDSSTQKAHISPANLSSNHHRQLEAFENYKALSLLFRNRDFFCLHQALPDNYGDEGAANSIRLWHRNKSLSLFIYGRSKQHSPSIQFPARQYQEASQIIIKKHHYLPDSTLLIPQNPAAIDAGVFHNDVIAFGAQNLLIAHEKAFASWHIFEEIKLRYKQYCHEDLNLIIIKESELPLQKAIETYLFNAQLITDNKGFSCLFPSLCKTDAACQAAIRSILAQVQSKFTVKYSELSESLANGGGPACLRFNIFLNYEALQQLPTSFRLTEEKASVLQILVQNDYPDSLSLKDFCHPKTIKHIRKTIERTHRILSTN